MMASPLSGSRSTVRALVGNEVDFLRSRSDRVRLAPEHVTTDLDPRERRGTIAVG